MKILIAEDDRVSRKMLETVLVEWGHETVTARDGLEAWRLLQETPGLDVALLDWLMPGIDGLEVCRRARAWPSEELPYLILLTVRASREDVARGLRGGADDYITKPFDLGELEARLHAARRVVELQRALAGRVKQLEVALSQVHHLQGLLPICSYCKSIRDDQNYWHQVEAYLHDHAGTKLSHGICPECMEKFVKPEFERLGFSMPSTKS